MKKIIASVLISLCYSCVPSYSVLNKEYKHLKSRNPKQNVYVINSGLTKEYKILKKSKIYNIVDDSAKSDIRIKLNPLKNNTGFRCGNMMFGSMMTLGLIPYKETQFYNFSYDEINGSETQSQSFDLELGYSLWLFNFVYPKSFNKQSGKALLGEYLNNLR